MGYWRYMKRLLIGLMAFALTLGVACKKDAVVQPESSVSKKELSAKDLVKPNTSALVDGSEIGGANQYPHSTGLCYCGAYSVCHPQFIYDNAGGHVIPK